MMTCLYSKRERPWLCTLSIDMMFLLMFLQAKMKSLLEDWKNLFSHQKQVGRMMITSFILIVTVPLCLNKHETRASLLSSIQIPSVCFTSQIYVQLAEDDKIRYKNEIKAWEDHMVEIGREDLVRERKKPAAKTPVAKTGTKKAKAKAVKKPAATGKSKTTTRSTKSSSAKTV